MSKRSSASQARFLAYVVDPPRAGGSPRRKIIPWRRAGCGFLYKDNPDGTVTIKDRVTAVRVTADTVVEGVGLCRDALKAFNDERFYMPHAEDGAAARNAQAETEIAAVDAGETVPADPPTTSPDYRRPSRVMSAKSDGQCAHCHSPIRIGQRVWLDHDGKRAHEVCWQTRKYFNPAVDRIKVFDRRAYMEKSKWVMFADTLIDEGDFAGRAMASFIQRFDHLKDNGYDMKWDASWMRPGYVEAWGTDGRGVRATLVIERDDPATPPEPRPRKSRKRPSAQAKPVIDIFAYAASLSQEGDAEEGGIPG